MKKILALLLVICMMISIAACSSGSNESTSSSTTGSSGTSSTDSDSDAENSSTSTDKRDVGGLQLPLCDETQELDVWTVFNNSTVADPNDLPGVQELEKRTNVHVNWIPVAIPDLQQKMGILYSSDNLPDIVYSASFMYPGGIAKGIEDGVILDMDQVIRENMPNYMAILNSNEVARREATSDDGRLLGAYLIVTTDTTIESEGTPTGLAYRKDLFDPMNLELPETVAGWHDVLLTAKENGMTEAFMPQSNGGSNISMAYGVTTSSRDNYLQRDGDTIICSALQDGFGQYLDEMRKWYEEGIIGPNFTAGGPGESRDYSSYENGTALLYDGMSCGMCGTAVYDQGNTTNPNTYLQGIENLVLNEGDTPMQCSRRVIAKDPVIITTACEKPELAAQWLDYWWTEEGAILSWYGLEGVTYEIGDDGTPQYTEMVTSNEEGLPPENVLSQYAFNQGSWLGRHNLEAGWKVAATRAVNGSNTHLDMINLWSKAEPNVSITEALAFTDAEGVELSNLQTAVNTLIEEYMVNYINGTNTTSFDDFRENLHTFGADRVVEIYQAAYDRFLQR